MTQNRTLVISFAAIAAIAVGVLIVADPFAAKAPTLKPADPAVLAMGESLYKAQCASCHGAQLEGQPDWRTRGPNGLLPAPPHDASGHTWHHPDETLFRITKYGVAKTAGMADYASAMPVYEGVLSDEQIVAVLSWIKAQWPPQVRDKHDQINAQAQRAGTR